MSGCYYNSCASSSLSFFFSSRRRHTRCLSDWSSTCALPISFKGDRVKVLSAEGRLTPLGTVPRMRTFEVVGIFSSGLYDYDNSWVYVPINAAQRLFGLGDIASAIEVKIKDLDQAKVIGKQIVDRVGRDLDFTDWMTQNHAIFQALQLERLVMFITIGLIVLVAALNIEIGRAHV